MDLREMMKTAIDESGALDEYVKEEIFSGDKEKIESIDLSTEITKDDILTYLKESGTPLTEENYIFAEKYLKKQAEDGKTEVSKGVLKKKETVSHLDEYTTDEMKTMLNIALLKKLTMLSEKVSEEKYEYVVETVMDKTGATNVTALSNVLRKYADKGYRVVSIFTNELGKNGVSVAGLGVNSTCDQVVVIFERLKKVEE